MSCDKVWLTLGALAILVYPEASSTTVAPTPSKPTVNNVTEVASSHIRVTWQSGGGVLNKIIVTVRSSGGDEFNQEQNVTGNPSSAQDVVISRQLDEGETYTVKVTAFSNGVASASSDQKSITLAPSKPTVNNVTEVASSHIRVTWQSGGGVLNKIIVTVRSSGGDEFNQEQNVTGNPSSAQDVVISRQLDEGETYTVKVTAFSNGVASASSKEKSITLMPATPSHVQILTITQNSVTVAVTVISGRYTEVQVKLSPQGGSFPVSTGTKYVVVNTASEREKNITVTQLSPALTPGVQYTARVSTRSGTTSSSPSGESNRKTVVPATPSHVQILTITQNSVTVAVTVISGRYTGVEVKLSPQGGSFPVSTGTKDVVVNTASEREKNITVTQLSPALTPGVQYTARVSTRSGTTSSSPSGESNRKTVVPATPSHVQILTITQNSVTVAVTVISGRYTGVEVKLSPQGGSFPVSTGTKDVVVNTASEREKNITVTQLSPALTPGVQYTARVSTRSGTTSSSPSGESNRKTVAPSTPVLVSATPSSADRSISVTWKKGTGLVDKFYLMATGPGGWSTEEEIPYQIGQNEYNKVLRPPESGLYHLTLKAQSNVNSSESQQHSVQLPASPVNITVVSKTSRSFELMWERPDTNVKNFRLLLFKEDICDREVHFNEQNASQTQMSCSNVSHEQFEENQMNFTYSVTGLLPYIHYEVKMYLKIEGVANESGPATLSVRTNPEVPSKIKYTNVTVEGAENVSVCWSQPEPFPGPTNYTLTLMDRGQDPQQDRQLVIPGFDSQCALFNSLEEFWPYKVKLIASTEVGDGPDTKTIDFRTLEAAPGKVTQVKIKQVQNNYHQLNATWKAPQLRDRNANITNFNLSYKLSETSDNETVFTLPWSSGEEVRYAQIVSVKPEQNYTFRIFALSENFTGDVVTEIYYAPAGRPPPPSGCVIDCTNPPASHSAEPESISSFSVTFNTDFFTDNTNGKITDYGLVVEAVQNTEPTASSSVAELKASHFQEIDNWYEAKKNNFQTYYRATPLDWSYQSDVSGNRPKREAAVSTFTVGADTTCSEKDVTSYCNGPLNPGMEYRVKAFSCTAGGCTETKYVGGYRTKGFPLNGGMIAMGVVIAALSIVLTVFLVFFLIRRRRRQERSRAEDLTMDPYETMKPATVNAEKNYEGMRFDQMAISASRLTVSDEKINEGKHKLLKGTLREADGNKRIVIIRKITGNNVFERCSAEIDIMRNIGAHPHIVSFLGYCMQNDNNLLLINGFEEKGDLQTFLRNKRRSGSNKELTESNLLLLAENVAEGMAHLSRLEILHGDLRAVNVLVGRDLTAKISGLQQARPVGYEPKAAAKLNFPLCRWASVETLEKKVYTPQSEVWSFGVLMWEIMTYGATPYGKMKSVEIRNLLRQNCRLACPKSCQIPLYSVMLECWRDDPEERPTFQELSSRLAAMTTDAQQYMNIGIYESLDFTFEDAREDASY